jgi:hypothetical protein
MSPIDFILFNGDSDPNQPVYQIAEAMQEPIRIRSQWGDCQILSYYWEDGVMVLDVEMPK